MKTILQTTKFVNDIQIDLNYLEIQLYKNPLVIATREAQIYRILDWQDRNNYPPFKIIGWWDLLKKGYLCTDGLVRTAWVKHDAIFFLDRDRCSDINLYDTLILLIKNLV